MKNTHKGEENHPSSIINARSDEHRQVVSQPPCGRASVVPGAGELDVVLPVGSYCYKVAWRLAAAKATAPEASILPAAALHEALVSSGDGS